MAETAQGKSWLRSVLEQAMEDVAELYVGEVADTTAKQQKFLEVRNRCIEVWKRFDLGDPPEFEIETKVRRVG